MKNNRFWLENGLYAAWTIALIATAGSLYFSEVLHYLPCRLCWFQRIFMYPLVFVLGVAAIKKDHRVYRYVLPLAAVGGMISIYHTLLQKTTWFKELATSCTDVPCEFDYLQWPGMLSWVTIPILALIAFVLIFVVMLLVRRAVTAAV